jgi:3'-phosphoadenosine 5'-phosphosulfate sulfotransferase (PAPS reductase)/FAD synthetase
MGDKPIVVQSYGAGVQSRALLHMAINGVLPRPDIVIFADTQAEPEAVYQVVKEDKVYAEAAGIRFEIVTNGDLSDLTAWGGGSIYPSVHLKS